MIFDNALVDEDTRGPVPSINKDRIVRSIDRVNDEAVRGRIRNEQEICVFVCEIFCGAIQVTDDARVGSGFGRKDCIISSRVDMVGFEVEVVKG